MATRSEGYCILNLAELNLHPRLLVPDIANHLKIKDKDTFKKFFEYTNRILSCIFKIQNTLLKLVQDTRYCFEDIILYNTIKKSSLVPSFQMDMYDKCE